MLIRSPVAIPSNHSPPLTGWWPGRPLEEQSLPSHRIYPLLFRPFVLRTGPGFPQYATQGVALVLYTALHPAERTSWRNPCSLASPRPPRPLRHFLFGILCILGDFSFYLDQPQNPNTSKFLAALSCTPYLSQLIDPCTDKITLLIW